MADVLACPGLRDIAAISGYYSQLTGVLAGFAFTALVVLLSPAQTEGDRRNNTREGGALLALFAAFIALAITSLSYSFLSGEPAEARGRMTFMEMVACIPFGLAAIMLFHGVTILLRAAHVDQLAIWAAHVVTVVAAPTLTLYYITNGASDMGTARSASATQSCAMPAAPPSFGLILSILLAMLLTVSLIPKIQPSSWRTCAHKLRDGVPIVVLATSVVAAVTGRGLATRPPSFVMSALAVHMYLAGTFVLLAVLGLILSLGYSGDPDRRAGRLYRATLRYDHYSD